VVSADDKVLFFFLCVCVCFYKGPERDDVGDEGETSNESRPTLEEVERRRASRADKPPADDDGGRREEHLDRGQEEAEDDGPDDGEAVREGLRSVIGVARPDPSGEGRRVGRKKLRGKQEGTKGECGGDDAALLCLVAGLVRGRGRAEKDEVQDAHNSDGKTGHLEAAVGFVEDRPERVDRDGVHAHDNREEDAEDKGQGGAVTAQGGLVPGRHDRDEIEGRCNTAENEAKAGRRHEVREDAHEREQLHKALRALRQPQHARDAQEDGRHGREDHGLLSRHGHVEQREVPGQGKKFLLGEGRENKWWSLPDHRAKRRD